MGDHLGSPCVAPSFWVLRGTILACHLSSQWVRPSPSPSAPGDRRSGHPNARYGPLKSCDWDFSPIYCCVQDPFVRGRSAKTADFLDDRGESYGWKRLVEGMGPVGDR